MEGHASSDLTGIALVALIALLCGMGLTRLRQPAIVGYILAGVVLGPSGLAVVEDRAQIDVLAELGVLLLLFIVGMELSVRLFKRLWKVAVATTLFQIAASLAVTIGASRLLDLPLSLAIFLGFAVAMSSTAVAIKILDDIGELNTRAGRITVGVLIAQDLAVVPMMLLIAAMGADGFELIALPKVALSIGLLVGLIVYLSRGRKITLPFAADVADSADLKPLAALAFCFGVAALAGLAGLSAAYGAFLAGLVIGNSTARHEMMNATQPIQSILLMVFFVSIGLLIDLDYLWQNLATVMTLFFLVTVFKTVVNVGFLGAIGQPWQHAFLAGVVMAQMGEFSFLLAVVAADAGVVDSDAGRLVVAVTVLSLSLSPLWVFTARRLRLLTQYGVTEAGDLVRMVYGPETELVTGALDQATTRSQRLMRMAALALRRRRQRRRRRRVAAVAAETTAKMAADEAGGKKINLPKVPRADTIEAPTIAAATSETPPGRKTAKKAVKKQASKKSASKKSVPKKVTAKKTAAKKTGDA